MPQPTAEQLSQLDALLLSHDEALTAQGEELVAALAGADVLARARLYAAAGAFSLAVVAIQALPRSLPPGPLRLLACDLAEHAVDLVESDVTPRPGQPARDPRCDEVISAVRAIARDGRPPSALEALLPQVLAADEQGWWETEAVYALLSPDPLKALDNAARSVRILVSNLARPPAAAAPQPMRDRLLVLLA